MILLILRVRSTSEIKEINTYEWKFWANFWKPLNYKLIQILILPLFIISINIQGRWLADLRSNWPVSSILTFWDDFYNTVNKRMCTCAIWITYGILMTWLAIMMSYYLLANEIILISLPARQKIRDSFSACRRWN